MIKPNMDCEQCWLIVNEFDGNHACDDCIADAREKNAPAAAEDLTPEGIQYVLEGCEKIQPATIKQGELW
jgi:hypothetical protein